MRTIIKTRITTLVVIGVLLGSIFLQGEEIDNKKIGQDVDIFESIDIDIANISRISNKNK